MRNSASVNISLLRPILIFLVVTTHIQGNLYVAYNKDVELTVGNFLHVLLSGALSVSALPLLSIISGYLAVYTYKKYGYLITLRKKTWRILVPMLVWNLIMALIIYNMQSQGVALRADLTLYPFNLETWFYGLVGLFRLPANPPLYFLRELFLCFLLVPVLFQISKSKIATAAVLSGVAYMSVKGINFGFFHRIDIYGFFLLGLFLHNTPALGQLYHKLSNPFSLLGYLLLFGLGLLLLTQYSFQAENTNFILFRKISTLFGPLAFWIIGQHMMQPFKNFLLWLSPASFPVFLGHILFLNVYWALWIKIFSSTPLGEHYKWYWLSSFILCYLVMGVMAVIYRKATIRLKAFTRTKLNTKS